MSEMLPQESYVITCYVIFYVQYPKVRHVEEKPRLSDVEFKKMIITYGYEFYDPFMDGHISILNIYPLKWVLSQTSITLIRKKKIIQVDPPPWS